MKRVFSDCPRRSVTTCVLEFMRSIKQVGGPKRRTIVYPVIVALIICTSFTGLRGGKEPWTKRDGHAEIVLLTSFWVQKAPVPAHEIEVKGAILANLKNPHISEIHIVLEGATRDFGCDDLIPELHGIAELNAKESGTQVKCTPWKGAQPTYYDMFMFSKQENFMEKIMVLHNADMVFDHSIAALRHLHPSSMVVIATSGLDRSRTPEHIASHFEEFTRLPFHRVVSRCYNDKTPRTSWDAYAFHPRSLEIFEDDFTDVTSGETFHMNRNGAENAALEAVSRHSPIVQFSQICDHVKMWHFHTTAKMHKSEVGVKHSQLKPESCTSDVYHCLTPGNLRWTVRDVSELT